MGGVSRVDVGAGDGVDDGAELQQPAANGSNRAKRSAQPPRASWKRRLAPRCSMPGSWLGSPLPPVWFTFTRAPINLV